MIKKSYSFENGSSLLEVMIALFVLAVGMLGVLAMQATAVKTAQQASSVSQANVLLLEAYEFLITAKASNIPITDYTVNFDDNTASTEPTCVSSSCLPAEIAAWNKYKWRTAVESLLPSGGSAITLDEEENVISIEVRFVKQDLGVDDFVSSINTIYETKVLKVRDL